MRLFKVLLLSLLSAFPYSLAAQTKASAPDKAISFDGKDDMIKFGDVYRELKLPYSISVWAYLDANNFYLAPIFSNRNCIPLYNGFWFVVDKNYIAVEYGDGIGGRHPAYRRGKAATVALAPGAWVHITAVVRSSQSIDLYLNGVNAGGEFIGNSSYPMDSTEPKGFASAGYFLSNNVELWYKGMLDDIRLWDRALSEEEVKKGMCNKLTGDEEGLIGYWDFNEASGSTVFDKSSKKIHGKFSGNPTRVACTLPCSKSAINDEGKPVKPDVTKGGDK